MLQLIASENLSVLCRSWTNVDFKTQALFDSKLPNFLFSTIQMFENWTKNLWVLIESEVAHEAE